MFFKIISEPLCLHVCPRDEHWRRVEVVVMQAQAKDLSVKTFPSQNVPSQNVLKPERFQTKTSPSQSVVSVKAVTIEFYHGCGKDGCLPKNLETSNILVFFMVL